MRRLLSRLLVWLVRWLDRTPPARPVIRGVQFLRLDPTMRLAFYALSLSPVDATDVVKRVLTESVDGGSPVTREVFGDDELGYVPGSAVSLSLQDFDAAGNGSMPSAPFAFTAEALDEPFLDQTHQGLINGGARTQPCKQGWGERFSSRLGRDALADGL